MYASLYTGEQRGDFFPEVTGGTDDDVLVNMRQVSRDSRVREA